MHVRIYDPSLNQTLLSKEYPDRYSADVHNIIEFNTDLTHPMGNGVYKEIYFDGVHIGYGHALLAQQAKFNFESDFESVELHFALKGNSTAKTSMFDRAISFESNQHNIIYANQAHGEMHWQKQDFQLFEVNLSPCFFQRYLPQDSALFESFRSKIENKRSDIVLQNNQLITFSMGQIIRDIMECKRTGLFKKMYLEAKVIELLMLQLEQFDNNSTKPSFKKTDIDKIYAAKDFLSTHIDEQLSLVNIAHKFGTNEFTLKKGFKELFGTTVFGYWNDLKMNQALKMLLDEDMQINEIADAVGYQNARHFSTAFARKFGASPSQIKKGKASFSYKN